MHQSFVSTAPPPTGKGGIMNFQSLGISPALWGQADDNNPALSFRVKFLNVIIPVSQFILPPGQLAPRGSSQPRLACLPGGKLSRDILPLTLVIFTPGGQAVQAGLSCPPPSTNKNIYMLFCYFFVSF